MSYDHIMRTQYMLFEGKSQCKCMRQLYIIESMSYCYWINFTIYIDNEMFYKRKKLIEKHS